MSTKTYAAIATDGTIAVFVGKPIWRNDDSIGYTPDTSLEVWGAQIVLHLGCKLTVEQAKDSLVEVGDDWQRLLEESP